MPVKLAIVASHPIQYWAPVYRSLMRQPSLQIKVFYVAENGAEEYFDREFNCLVKWDRPLTEGYPSEFLRPGFTLDDFGFFSVDANNVKQALTNFQPDFLLINGYGHRVNWRSVFARVANMKVMYISDSNSKDIRAPWKKTIKKILLSRFFKRVDYFLTTSPSNTEYLIEHNADARKFVAAPLPTDIEWLKKQQQKITNEQIVKLRKKLNISDDHKIVLYAGKLVAHKRPEDVIRLIYELKNEKVSAILVGSGEQQASLRELTAELGLLSRVVFAGFVNQSGLPNYFCLADVLVFPSSKEPYGLITSEVLPFGLPILAADNIGAVGASIREGVNALLYPCGNIDRLSSHAHSVLSDKELFQRLSNGSREIAENFDVSVLVDIIVSICHGDR